MGEWNTVTRVGRLNPVVSNNSDIGNSTDYFDNMYASDVYYQSLFTFDIYEDLDLIDGMEMVLMPDENGNMVPKVDPATIPDIIKGTDTPENPESHNFIDAAKADGLLFGAIRQLRQETKDGRNAIRDELDLRTPDQDTGKQDMDGNMQIVLDKNAKRESRFSVFKDGGDGLAEELMRLDERGNLRLKGALMPNSLDLAEYHPVLEPVEAGDVLVADRFSHGKMRKCDAENDKAVVGIVSALPGIALGAGIDRLADIDSDTALQIEEARALGDKETEEDLWLRLEQRFKRTHAAIALSGTVLCKVDAAYGSIEVGDLLVSSPTPGHAMRSDEPVPGTVIAKALEPVDFGTSAIKVLVMLR